MKRESIANDDERLPPPLPGADAVSVTLLLPDAARGRDQDTATPMAMSPPKTPLLTKTRMVVSVLVIVPLLYLLLLQLAVVPLTHRAHMAL